MFSRAGLTLAFLVLSASATRHSISCPSEDKKGKHLQFHATEVIEFGGKFSCEYEGGAGKCLYNAENPHSLSSGSNDCPEIKSDSHGLFDNIFHHRSSTTHKSSSTSTKHSSTSTKHSTTTSKPTSTHSSTTSKATSTTSHKHRKHKHHKSKTSSTHTSTSSASESTSTSSKSTSTKHKHHKTHKFTKSRSSSKPTSTSHSTTTSHSSTTTKKATTTTIKPTYSTEVPGLRIVGGVSTITFGSESTTSTSPSPTSTSPFAKNIKFSSKAGNSTSSALKSNTKSALWVLVPAAGFALMAV